MLKITLYTILICVIKMFIMIKMFYNENSELPIPAITKDCQWKWNSYLIISCSTNSDLEYLKANISFVKTTSNSIKMQY